MALIVEDGSVVEGAQTYCDSSYVDSYATARNLTTWTGTTAEKEAAILNAMVYIESRPYKGYPTQEDQPLVWPRYEAIRYGYTVDSDTIPVEVINALCEAAIRQIYGDIMPDLKRGGMIKRKKIDVLETEYFEGAPSTTKYQRVDMILSPLLKNSNTLVLA